MSRVPRAEQSARNRAAIVAAARTVFLRDGYHGATVDAVAEEAGFTIGALYSRFNGKADLFLAVLEDRVAERADQFAEIAPGSVTVADVAREFGRRWAGILRHDLDWQLLVIEFRVHAARDPELGARYAALHERSLRTLAENMASALPASIDAAAVDRVARVGLAAAVGAALARVAEGDAFTDGLVEEMSVALADLLGGNAG